MIYVLKIRYSGEDDEVFLFRQLRDAQVKVYEYFGEPVPNWKNQFQTESLDDLEERYFAQDKGYFTITHQPIQ